MMSIRPFGYVMDELRPLNNCEVFKQLRIEITKFHNQEKNLKQFVYFSGNGKYINDLSQRVVKVLLEHGLVEQQRDPNDPEELLTYPSPTADLDQLRGALMYLVLNSIKNSNCDEAELGRYNPQCVHLLSQLPEPMPQMLTVSLALKAGMKQSLLDFLACGPNWLTSQYYDTLNDLLSHLGTDYFDSLQLICAALNAVTKAICYRAPPDAGAGAMDTYPNLIDNSLRLLQRHLLYNNSNGCAIRVARTRKRYLGEAIAQLMDVILCILAAIKERPPIPDYFLVFSLRSPALNQLRDGNNAVSQLRNFADKLIDRVQILVQHVSINVYMIWQEMESSSKIFNLQAHVCNKSLQLLNFLVLDEKWKMHVLCSQLPIFANGAQSFKQRLESFTMGELLGFLDGNLIPPSLEQLHAALTELLSRSICFGNDECVETIVKHVEHMTYDHLEIIFKHLADVRAARLLGMDEFEDMDDGDMTKIAALEEFVMKVVWPVFQKNLNCNEKLNLLILRDHLKLLKLFSFKSDAHYSRRILFFNQLSYNFRCFPMDAFLELCFEDPSKTWWGLLQMAMTHRRYAALYARVLSLGASHATHHVTNCVRSLMVDERLISQPKPLDAYSDQLLRMYEMPVIFNGMKRGCLIKRRYGRLNIQIKRYRLNELTLNLDVPKLPYSGREILEAQDMYLGAFANGLSKFTVDLNYVALERIAKTLLDLESVEHRINYYSRKCMRVIHNRISDLKMRAAAKSRIKKARGMYKLAKAYVALHEPLSLNRISHWHLVFEVIFSIDKLRGSLETFEPARIAILDLLVKYYMKNMTRSYFISENTQYKMKAMKSDLIHDHLWNDGKLTLLQLDVNDPVEQVVNYAKWLPQASTQEATKLFGHIIHHKLDNYVMTRLARDVDARNSSNANFAYNSIFKCYMRAFKKHLIKPLPPSEYPILVEQILKTPKLSEADNALAAVANLKILLNAQDALASSKILEFIANSLK